MMGYVGMFWHSTHKRGAKTLVVRNNRLGALRGCPPQWG